MSPTLGYLIIIALGLLIFYVLIWQISLLVALVSGAPVVYTNKRPLEQALDLAQMKAGDIFVDLGCGNGRSLILAAKKYGARCIGVERSPLFYLHSLINIYLSGQAKNITVVLGDFKKVQPWIKKSRVIYVYLLNNVMAGIEGWLFSNINPNTIIVSMSFEFPHHQAYKTIRTKNLGQETKIRLYKQNHINKSK